MSHDIHDSPRQIRVVHLELDDDRHVTISGENGGQRRHPNALASKRRVGVFRAATEMITGVGPRKLVGGPVRDRAGEVRRPLQCPVVVDDDDAIAREVNVELQTLGAERQAAVEGRDRILRREHAPASMREHLRPATAEERM